MWLPDGVVAHLRSVATEPPLDGTRYRLVAHIADGGMGSVWRVTDTELGRDVALKVLSFEDSSGETAQRLQREARILAQLEHPNVVPIYDAGTLADGRPYYCMRLVDGPTLADAVAAGPSLQQCLATFQRICDAVAFAHSRGVVHRDLKPGNIMTGAFGEVFVLDWGIARVLPRSNEPAPEAWRTHQGTVAGTPSFVAPEQLSGNAAEAGERADIYALGRILSFLVERSAQRKSKRLDAIAAKAASLAPKERYASARELSAEIERFLEGCPVVAYKESLIERALRFASNNKTLMLLIAAYVIVRVLIFLLRRI